MTRVTGRAGPREDLVPRVVARRLCYKARMPSLSRPLVPVLVIALALLTTAARAETTAEVGAEPASPPLRLVALELGAGAAAGAASSAAALALGTWIGSLPTGTVSAVLPPFLLLAALPPLAVTAAEWLVADSSDAYTARWSPALWVALGTQVL
ncbi:MAG: hypothetical protein ACK4N5_03100, partial [Myxococcales bacterium]